MDITKQYFNNFIIENIIYVLIPINNHNLFKDYFYIEIKRKVK